MNYLKQKLLLTVAALLGGVISVSAQTDVTSTYITNADFEGTYSVFVNPSSDRAIYQPNGWTVTRTGSDKNDMTILKSSDLASNSFSAFTVNDATSRGEQTYWTRLRWGNNTGLKLSQTKTLPAGNYKLTAFVLNYNQDVSNNKAEIFAGSNSVTASNSNTKGDGAGWKTLTVNFTLDESTEIEMGVKLTHATENSNNKGEQIVGVDNFKLIYTDFKAELRTVIAQAQAINARISTLGDDITTAQTTLNDASASKSAIDSAVSTLRTAISTKLGAYTGLDAAGDDITSFIVNNGFETSPTFDGTSLGSGSDPKSNATPAAGSTLLFNSTNVYQVNGWELMTTETSDYARTFTMPYDKTLYVQSNNAVAGQAVASPTNGSSVTTDNSNLLFVEANWCQNAVLGVKQTIPLPAGSYRLTFDSYVTTSVANANSLCGVSYGETTNYKWPAATNTWTANEVDFTLTEQKDVTISMGYTKINNVGGVNSAFLFVDNVKLTYFDPLKLAQIQWQAVHDALEALDATALPDAAENAITTELAKDVPTSSADDVNTAKAALQALIDSYDGIKAAYNKLSALITLATNEKTNSTGTKDDIESAISTATSNIETRTAADDLTSDYNTLETARQTYVTSGAQPTSGNVFDYTFKIPDAAVTSATDWSSKRTNSGEQYTGAPDNTYFDTYNENRNIQKNIGTLRLGKYELKAATRSEASVTVGNIYVSQNAANLNQTNIHHDGNTGGDLGNGWSWTTVSFDNYVDDKDITLGFYSECGSSKWAGADDFHLYYKGNTVDNETAEALKETVVSGKMNATVASTQATALSNFESEQTFENYNTLKSAIDAASNSKTVYEALDAALTKVEGWTTTTAPEALRTKYNNGLYSDETTADNIYAEYQEAEITALAAASATDWSSAIINASFETGDMTGWTAESRNDTGVKDQSNGTYSITSGDAVDGLKLFNSWGGTAENNVYQTIKNLPAGTYTLVAVLAGFPGESLVIAANEETGTTVVADDKTVGYLTSVTFTLDATADVIIKASNTKSQGGSDASFIKADNFQLYVGSSVPASASKPNLLYAINNATNARKSANEGAGIFQIPAAAGTTLAGAISDAQAVYDNASATLEQINQAITDVDAARTTYVGTELNAPADGKRYYVKVATSDHAKIGNAIIIVPGESSANNPTGYALNANFAPNANLNQAVTFTQVSGNTYNISFETAGGTAYLTYGTTNGSAAGWSNAQIQATTDSEKKGEFLIAATSTENVFNIYNTLTNSTIACQSGGNIYTEANNADFTVAEASQASVTVSCKAGKYGTVIFPFTPDVSTGFDGITFYSCASVNTVTNRVQLEEETPVANVPYLIYNDGNENFSKAVEGWGTAGAESYTVGLLTGVYTTAAVPENSYVLQTPTSGENKDVQAFYKVSGTFDATANKCYLTYSAPNQAHMLKLFFGEDETTGIESIDNGQLIMDNGAVYDLQGRKVQNPKRGMYIINGKKVVVK